MKSKLLIYGVGKSGASAIRLAHLRNIDPVVVNSGAVNSWKQDEFGKNLFSENDAIAKDLFSQVETIVLSPGIPRELEHLKQAIELGVEVISEIEFAYRNLNELKAPIIAITGTNGKTTTTTMIQDLFNLDEQKVFVGGNIGTPFCDYVIDGKKAEFIVLELSSFQLESMVTFRANTAIFLNLFQNHGERYSYMEDYARAKFHIVDRMKEDDLLIYPVNYPLVRGWADNQNILKQSFDELKIKELPLLQHFDLTKFKLVGDHNYTNLYCALLVGMHYGVKEQSCQELINTFCGVEFRLQYIENPYNLSIYNDAKSTNWNATISAVKGFNQKDKVKLIVGGQFRGHGDAITDYLSSFAMVDEFILIGETTDYLAEQLGDHRFFKAYTLDHAKEYLFANGDSKFTIVFSPAYPSFDQFVNYVERGRFFTQLFQVK